MSFFLGLQIDNLAELKLNAWCTGHEDELYALDLSQRNDLLATKKAEFTTEARLEVQAAEAARARALRNAVWSSSLASTIRPYYTDRAERDLLEAERDARIEAIQTEYDDRLPQPYAHVQAYNQARVDLLLQCIAAAGLAICQGCQIAKADVQLVLLDGYDHFWEQHGCGSPADWWAKYDRIMELCTICRAGKSRPPASATNELLPPSAYCIVRPAEDRADGTYAQFEDGWRPAPETAERIKLDFGPSGHISPRLEQAWQIPPRLESRGNALVIACQLMEDDVPLENDMPPEETTQQLKG